VRFLVDANLSPRVAKALGDLGHDAIHVVDAGLLSESDTTIAEFATNDARIIVTSDSDFGTILARTGGNGPSVILLRHLNDASPPRQVELIEVAIASGADALATGAIVTMSRGRLRVRNLPIV
jgi:predicted nuclease of predicted toxin-antitoxin system